MAASSCAMAIWLKRESSRIGIKINHIPCLYILILPLSLILSPMGRGKGEGASPLSFFVLPFIHKCFILCPSLEFYLEIDLCVIALSGVEPLFVGFIS